MLYNVYTFCILPIVLLIVCGLIGFKIVDHIEGDDIGYMISGFISAFVSGILILVFLFTIDKVRNNAETEEYVSDTQKIYCLNDSSEVSGRLYLYSGYIKEDMVYRMYVDYGEGKKLKEVKADYSCIIEDNNTEIVTYKTKYKSDTITWWFGESNKHETYEIHIPKGSITSDYKIDNK